MANRALNRMAVVIGTIDCGITDRLGPTLRRMSAPGWFPDPDDSTARRYWDGATWSAPLRSEAESPVLAPPSPPADVPGARPDPQSKKNRIAGLVTVGLLVLAGGVFAIYWFAIRTPTMTVRGTMDINGSPGDNYTVSAPDSVGNTTCAGTGGYDDITGGAGVTVTDASGKTLGVGALETGIYIDGTDACIFGWQVDRVPADKDFYGVVVTHRGNVQFSKAQMKAGPDVSIGS